MNLEPVRETVKNPPEQFTGDVWVDMIALGARTAWHSHARGQYLHVTSGVARFGTRDGNIIDVHPGQTLYTPPGEEHWHASANGTFMEHLAILENDEDPAATTAWAEHITDAEYEGRQG